MLCLSVELAMIGRLNRRRVRREISWITLYFDQILTQILHSRGGSLAAIDEGSEVLVLIDRISEATKLRPALPDRLSPRAALFVIAGTSLLLWLGIAGVILKLVL